jgi:hypothetical protein
MAEARVILLKDMDFALSNANPCCGKTLGEYLHGAAAVDAGSVVKCRTNPGDPSHRLRLGDDGVWRPVSA